MMMGKCNNQRGCELILCNFPSPIELLKRQLEVTRLTLIEANSGRECSRARSDGQRRLVPEDENMQTEAFVDEDGDYNSEE